MRKLVSILALGFLFGCNSEKDLEKRIGEVIKKNPSLITEAIKANPVEFVEAFQDAVTQAKGELAKKRETEEKKKLLERFDNPLKPVIRKDDAIRGTKGAPIVLVEYSDFECPFCTRGFSTVQDLMKKYPGKVQFIYKHLPLSFHPNAMIAAKYYEAARIQSHEKAFNLHDEIFANQRKLKNGEKFLKSIAKKVGLNMSKLAKDIKSKAVQARIDEDRKEAASFNMQGTPGFIINGIPVRGAYPVTHFEEIVEQLKAKGKLKL